MEGQEIQHTAVGAAELLAGSDRSFPFGPEHEVWKVADKMFLLLTILNGEPIITLKCQPEESLLHREIYPSITPGYHMNKRHWITVRGGEKISEQLVQDLVNRSWQLVVDGLPKRLRPW